jgi:5-formyltetrahydrofolate cyclo-ligase
MVLPIAPGYSCAQPLEKIAIAVPFHAVLFTGGTMEPADKSAWRRRVREAIRAIPAEERAADSRRLCDIFLKEPVWLDASIVLCFAPFSDEPDISSIIDDALLAKKTVALPRFNTRLERYEAAMIATPQDRMRGAFGALEPHAGCPAVSLNHLDLILVPAVAFDFAGRRLGRGKGFYDRLLAEFHGHKCGIWFDEQLVAELPEEPHDVRVNSIVTPTRWFMC